MNWDNGLAQYLGGFYSYASIDLQDKKWHEKANIPPVPGWYFIRTNATVSLLCEQKLWSDTYITKRQGQTKPVKNYNLATRASRFNQDLSSFWNVAEVYSGMATDLMARAREHTFPDPGTAGLALSRYPALMDHEWLFGYVTLSRFIENASCNEMLLRLGEQIWRSKYGWPLLCAE